MAIFQVKKYKLIKDEKGKKIEVLKTKEEYNKETRNGTMTWYFVDRYILNNKSKQYKSKLFALKREAEEQERLFLANPIEYIKTRSKRAKNKLEIKIEDINGNDTLNYWFNKYVEYKLLPNSNQKETTIYGRKKIWDKHFKDMIGDSTLKDIDLVFTQKIHDTISKLINDKTNTTYSIETLNTYHSTLVAFFDFLYRRGKIELNYAKVIGTFSNPAVNKNTKKKIRYQILEDFNLFMSVVDDSFWYSFFNFLFWHGPRKGEQRAIKISNINLEYDSITFENTFTRSKDGGETIGSIKNGKERTIYLTKESKPHIKKLIDFYQQMEGYSDDWFLFGGAIKLSKQAIERKLTYYYDILEKKYPNKKINRLTHHEFGRHSHASYLLAEGLKKGMALEEIYAIIAQRLGDTIDVIKQNYAHLYETENNDKAKNILN